MKTELEISDEEIVEKIINGHSTLFRDIVKRYEAKLLRYARYLLEDSVNAEDAVQEAFIKSYINLKGFDLSKKFSSWIYRITHNECMNFTKRSRLSVSLDSISLDFFSSQIVEQEVIEDELKLGIQQCLKKIPLLYKEPLILFYFERQSYEEISDILKTPVSTVGTRIRRAKNLLKGLCQENN